MILAYDRQSAPDCIYLRIYRIVFYYKSPKTMWSEQRVCIYLVFRK